MEIRRITRAVPSPPEGRYAIVTMRWAWDAMDAAASGVLHRTKTRQRTAKSCGPGAATLASIQPARAGTATVTIKAAHRGEHEVSRKAIARGRPGCLGCTCQTRVRSSTTIAHGAAGAVGARSSLRPLFKEGATNWQDSGGKHAARMRAHAFPRPSGARTTILILRRRVSAVSKDGHGGLMVRDALRAPHHEGLPIHAQGNLLTAACPRANDDGR